MPVEAPGPQERGVEHVGPVRGGEHDDGFLLVESVELGEDLFVRLLALVMPAAQACATIGA